jgi:beta-N-acetylhexosaminidase
MPPVWRIRLVIIFLTIAAAGMGYVYFTQRLTPEERLALEQAATQSAVTPMPAPEPTAKNFAQLLAIPYSFDTSSASQAATLSFIAQNTPGFVVLFGEDIDVDTATETISEIKNEKLSADRPLIALDHEGGRVQRLSGQGFTVLPTWKRVCGQTPAQQTAVFASSSAELKTAGVEIVFAPVVDVAENNIILKDRVCAGDPEKVSEVSLRFVDAFQKQHILPVIKHYPGLGSATQDTHSQFTTVLIEDEDVFPFKSILDQYPKLGVMTAHVGVENQIPDVPCSLSFSCVNQLFELYPDVIVFSDALEMIAASYDGNKPETPKTLEQVTIDAILAGNTVVVFGPEVTVQQLEKILSRMKQEYTNSNEFRTRIDVAIDKINSLRAQYEPEQDITQEIINDQ